MSAFYRFIASMEGKGTNYQLFNLVRTKNDTWGELFRLMRCPSIKYNITKIPAYTGGHITLLNATDNDLVVAIHHLLSLDLRGRQLQDAIMRLHCDCTKELQEVLSWIIARKNPARIGKILVNKVWPDLIRTQKYMGAVSGTDKALKRLFKACPLVNVQVKEDGMAVLVEYINGSPVSIHTRQGQDITRYFPVFLSRLRSVEGFTGEVHHELFVADEHRAGGNGLVNKAVKGENADYVDNCLHSVILDLYTEGNQRYRYEQMINFETEYSYRVVQKTFDNLEKAKEYAKTIIRNGGEGVVCKDPKGVFKDGKPWYNVKIKNEFVVDLVCLGFIPHRTKEGQIGALKMSTADGRLEVNVNLKTDEDRMLPYMGNYHGMIMRVRAESTTVSKGKKPPSLYLGRFDGEDWEEYVTDKSFADTYQEILDQEAMAKGLK